MKFPLKYLHLLPAVALATVLQVAQAGAPAGSQARHISELTDERVEAVLCKPGDTVDKVLGRELVCGSTPTEEAVGFMNNNLGTLGGGMTAFSLLLLMGKRGMAILRGKNGKSQTSFLEETDRPDSFFGQADAVQGGDGEGSSDQDKREKNQFDVIGDVDPIAEAQVYFAYRRYLGGITLLRASLNGKDASNQVYLKEILRLLKKTTMEREAEEKRQELLSLIEVKLGYPLDLDLSESTEGGDSSHGTTDFSTRPLEIDASKTRFDEEALGGIFAHIHTIPEKTDKIAYINVALGERGVYPLEAFALRLLLLELDESTKPAIVITSFRVNGFDIELQGQLLRFLYLHERDLKGGISLYTNYRDQQVKKSRLLDISVLSQEGEISIDKKTGEELQEIEIRN